MAIIDYGMGNLRSVAKAIEHVAPDPRRWEHFRNIRSEIAASKKLNPGW